MNSCPGVRPLVVLVVLVSSVQGRVLTTRELQSSGAVPHGPPPGAGPKESGTTPGILDDDRKEPFSFIPCIFDWQCPTLFPYCFKSGELYTIQGLCVECTADADCAVPSQQQQTCDTTTYSCIITNTNTVGWDVVGYIPNVSRSAGIALSLDSKGAPYVAYANVSNHNKASVATITGNSTWEYVGNSVISDGPVEYISLDIDVKDQFYIAYSDAHHGGRAITKAHFMRQKEWKTIWESQDKAAFISTGIDSTGALYIVYTLGNNSTPTVYTFASGNTQAGSGNIQAASGYIQAASGNTQAGSNKNWTASLLSKADCYGMGNNDGTARMPCAQADFCFCQTALYTSLTIDSNDTMYISFIDASGSHLRPVIYAYTKGIGWNNLSFPQTTSGPGLYTSLTTAPFKAGMHVIFSYQDWTQNTSMPSVYLRNSSRSSWTLLSSSWEEQTGDTPTPPVAAATVSIPSATAASKEEEGDDHHRRHSDTKLAYQPTLATAQNGTTVYVAYTEGLGGPLHVYRHATTGNFNTPWEDILVPSTAPPFPSSIAPLHTYTPRLATSFTVKDGTAVYVAYVTKDSELVVVLLVGGVVEKSILCVYKNTSDKEGKEKTEQVTKVEIGGPKGPEPTRYSDWERGGRCSDF